MYAQDEHRGQLQPSQNYDSKTRKSTVSLTSSYALLCGDHGLYVSRDTQSFLNITV